MTRPDARLQLWREGLLDPDEALDLAERVGGAPEVAAAEPVELGGWRVPPPGLGMALAVSLPVALSGAAEVASGERFSLHLPRRDDAATRSVVVLRRGSPRGWEVLAGPVGLERLALDAVGHRLDLVARGPVGVQRWAVAVVPSDAVDEAGLQRAVATGIGSVGSVDVHVNA